MAQRCNPCDDNSAINMAIKIDKHTAPGKSTRIPS